MGGNKSRPCGEDLAVSKIVEGNTEPRNKCRRCPDPVPVFSCEVIEELELHHLLLGEYPFSASAAASGPDPSSFIRCHISPHLTNLGQFYHKVNHLSEANLQTKELSVHERRTLAKQEDLWGKKKKEEESAEKRGETLQNFKEGKERRAGCDMSNPGNEKTSHINEPFHPGQQPDPMKSAINPPPPIYQASPSMPYQYHVYAGPPGAIPMQPQQRIPITNVQSVNEPDYLGYSIFTLLCCCLPLGIAVLVYSIKVSFMERGRGERERLRVKGREGGREGGREREGERGTARGRGREGGREGESGRGRGGRDGGKERECE
ncbi:hypothetical protein L345_17874, partial [Ophiophagus hannah]